MITWTALFQQNGFWQVVASGVTPAQYNEIFPHEVLQGTIKFYNPTQQVARLYFADVFIQQYGPTRCWWLLREDVLDRDEHVSSRLHAAWERAITDALLLDSGANDVDNAGVGNATGRDDINTEDWRSDDPHAPYGRLGWRARDDDADDAVDDDSDDFGWMGGAA